MSYRWSAYVTPKSPKRVAQKIFSFTVWCSYTSAVLGVVIVVDCLSICHTLALSDKQCTADILIIQERVITLQFSDTNNGLWGQPFYLKFALSDPPLQKNADLRVRQISSYKDSTIRDSEKVQLWQIGSRPQAFQRGIDEVRTLTINPSKGGPKSDFLKIKFNFDCIKSATNFLCVVTSSGKVVV